jgi:hypothetical protein
MQDPFSINPAVSELPKDHPARAKLALLIRIWSSSLGRFCGSLSQRSPLLWKVLEWAFPRKAVSSPSEAEQGCEIWNRNCLKDLGPEFQRYRTEELGAFQQNP